MKKYKVLLSALMIMAVLSGCERSMSYLKEGTTALKNKNYAAATDCFKNAVKKEKAYTPANNEEKKIQSANIKEAYKGLGMTYFEQKEYEKSLNTYLEMEKYEGNISAVTYRNMAICAKELDNREDAILYCNKGIEALNKDSKDAAEACKDLYIIPLKMYEDDLNFKEALKYAQGYSELFPDDAYILKEIDFLTTRQEN